MSAWSPRIEAILTITKYIMTWNYYRTDQDLDVAH